MPYDNSIFDLSHITVRPLTAEDSVAYRALRQKVLTSGDGKFFSDSYEREAGFVSEGQWRDWCTPTREHCTFGTFILGRLIGIMGIVAYGKPEQRMAEWEVIWLEPHYRRKGIAKLCYEKIWQWSLRHGYQKAVVFIRTDNIRSMLIHMRQGAVYSHTIKNVVWADRSVCDMYAFHLDLHAPQTISYGNALRTIEELDAFLRSSDVRAETPAKKPALLQLS